MSLPNKETEDPSSSNVSVRNVNDDIGNAKVTDQRPPAKRQIPSTVIEISDTESDDSDVCAVNSYQASADEVKRIRREYSSTSSSSDYSSDSESPWEDDSLVIEDEIVQEKAVRAQLNPRANRMDDPKLNSNLKSQELIDKVKTSWQEEKDYKGDEVTLTCKPFRLCRLHSLLENAEIINNIVDDMNTLDWSRKTMDLYEFHQTTDLANLTWQRSIRGIYELLKTEVMSLVSNITGMELTSVSASCSLYGPGDHLLVHDDRLGDRRVAFILYLAPWKPRAPPQPRVSALLRAPAILHNGAGDGDHKHEVEVQETFGSGWTTNMGGALELFECGEEGSPTQVTLRAYPANNTLAFFTVGPQSFHQVGEVLSLELPRLSINGWFHGPAEPPAPHISTPPESLAPHSQVVLLNRWVDSTYLSPRVRAKVQAQMERASEVCLREVLLPARCAELLHALEQPDVEWQRCGPAQQRRYQCVSEAWAALDDAGEDEHVVRGLLRLFSSSAFLRMLADCTDLPLAAYRRLELQRWSPGDFTLLPPREQYQQARLEAVLYVGAPARPVRGGHTVFVAPEEETEDALVTLPPRHNSLNLVYCDAGAAAFTKYLSKMTMRPEQHFYILTCTYTE